MKNLFKLIFILSLNVAYGCGHHNHLKENLQKQNPDCFVMEDLSIECPDPFVQGSESSGFGIEIKNVKPKPYEPIKKLKVK